MATNLARMGTNAGNFTLTNYALESTLSGISNLLAGMTNIGVIGHSNANGGALMSSYIPSSATNASVAQAAADAAQGDYGVDGLLSSLNPQLPSATPPAVNMTMEFCGQTIDLDPTHIFPGCADVSQTGFKIVFLLGFFLEVGRMFWELVKVRATAETGGVPDLDVSAMAEFLGIGGEIGGNFLGAIIAIGIPFAFITLFSAAMSYLFSNLGYSIADAMGITDFSNSMGGIGWYLLATFIPVNLAFSLLCTRITLTFTLAKIVALASAAARYLWGK